MRLIQTLRRFDPFRNSASLPIGLGLVYLACLGQKKLTLNNGDEYIRVRGIVRPEDISSNNVISSDRIANAEIKYIGAGDIANTAKAGWLQRILTDLSPY